MHDYLRTLDLTAHLPTWVKGVEEPVLVRTTKYGKDLTSSSPSLPFLASPGFASVKRRSPSCPFHSFTFILFHLFLSFPNLSILLQSCCNHQSSILQSGFPTSALDVECFCQLTDWKFEAQSSLEKYFVQHPLNCSRMERYFIIVSPVI